MKLSGQKLEQILKIFCELDAENIRHAFAHCLSQKNAFFFFTQSL